MAEYIDREAAKLAVKHIPWCNYSAVGDCLDQLPAADVKVVVRCKDCLHSRELNKYEKQLYLDECVGCTRHSVSYHDAVMMGDDFCSYGERRDSDG